MYTAWDLVLFDGNATSSLVQGGLRSNAPFEAAIRFMTPYWLLSNLRIIVLLQIYWPIHHRLASFDYDSSHNTPRGRLESIGLRHD